MDIYTMNTELLWGLATNIHYNMQVFYSALCSNELKALYVS